MQLLMVKSMHSIVILGSAFVNGTFSLDDLTRM